MTMSLKPAPMSNPRQVLENYNAADKAIVALQLLKATKRPGQKGVGPNRDDAPIFAELIEQWRQGKGGDKETLMQARHRVRKYARQVMASVYAENVANAAVTRLAMIQSGSIELQRATAEQELRELLKDVTGYGRW